MHYSLDNTIPAFYSKSLKTFTSGKTAPVRYGDFFISSFWGLRTVNILNSGQSLLVKAFSETPTLFGGFIYKFISQGK